MGCQTETEQIEQTRRLFTLLRRAQINGDEIEIPPPCDFFSPRCFDSQPWRNFRKTEGLDILDVFVHSIAFYMFLNLRNQTWWMLFHPDKLREALARNEFVFESTVSKIYENGQLSASRDIPNEPFKVETWHKKQDPTWIILILERPLNADQQERKEKAIKNKVNKKKKRANQKEKAKQLKEMQEKNADLPDYDKVVIPPNYNELDPSPEASPDEFEDLFEPVISIAFYFINF